MSRPSKWRNLAICGHASAGKTTHVDRLLATAGAVHGA
ncbi:MAG: GTP-binding protein [Rubripirellula sp.]